MAIIQMTNMQKDRYLECRQDMCRCEKSSAKESNNNKNEKIENSEKILWRRRKK